MYATINPGGKPNSYKPSRKPDFTPVTPIDEFTMKENIIPDDIWLTLQNEPARNSVIQLKDMVSWFKVSRLLRTKLPSVLLDFSMV